MPIIELDTSPRPFVFFTQLPVPFTLRFLRTVSRKPSLPVNVVVAASSVTDPLIMPVPCQVPGRRPGFAAASLAGALTNAAPSAKAVAERVMSILSFMWFPP